MNIIPGVRQVSDALAAEKLRMELIAQNIANAQTTRDTNGLAYKKKIAVFESYLPERKPEINHSNKIESKSVRLSQIQEDKSPGFKIHNPSHPHADKDGMVEYPNVQLPNEMVDMIVASRAYEANLSVIKTAKQMILQTLQIGK